MTSKRNIDNRLSDLETDAEDVEFLSISMLLSQPDRYELVDEDERIYRDTQTGEFGRAPWVDELETET
jgi:hypothetical protein